MSKVRANPSRPGLTLLELLLAVSITAMVGLAMTTVMTSVARGLTSTKSERSALTRVHAAYVRLRAYTDPALCLLQHDATRGFAIWLEDSKPGATVNLREMRAFWFDPASGRLTAERVKFPAAWPPELQDSFDIDLSPGADFLAEMKTQRTLGYTSEQTITDQMNGFTLAFDNILTQKNRRFRLTFQAFAGDVGDKPVLTAYSFPDYLEPR